MGEARGSEPGAPGRPNSTAPARARYRARRPLPGRPGPPRPRALGTRPTCQRAGQGLHLPNRVRAIVKALANCSPPPASPRAPPRPTRDHGIGPPRSHLAGSGEPKGRGGNAGARGGCRPGCRGPLQEKVMHALLSGAPGQGRAASPGRAGTCRCHRCTTRSAHGPRYLPGGEAWPRRSGRRRGGAAVAAAGRRRGAASQRPRRGALTPHPPASQTPSCDSVSHWIGRCASSRLSLGRAS